MSLLIITSCVIHGSHIANHGEINLNHGCLHCLSVRKELINPSKDSTTYLLSRKEPCFSAFVFTPVVKIKAVVKRFTEPKPTV